MSIHEKVAAPQQKNKRPSRVTASELRSEKRMQNVLAYNNSLLKRKVDNLNKLFMVYVYV